MTGSDTAKPRLLVVSAVMPYHGTAGQHARVRSSLLALRQAFHITFLGLARPPELAEARQRLLELVDDCIVLPRLIQRNLLTRVWHKVRGSLQAMLTGLRYSNYVAATELGAARVAASCQPDAYDIVLFEYWHSHRLTDLFHQHGVPCALDMHDILWRTYSVVMELHPSRWMKIGKQRRIRRYKACEEQAWTGYDLLIAINSEEQRYVEQTVATPVVLAGMGVDMAAWPYLWQPAQPTRIAFYGSMSGLGNRNAAAWIVQRIMPLVWQVEPEVELWIVGSNPPPEVLAMQQDPRIRVTGFVQDVAPTLASMLAVLCPWSGRFGFRSRLIEAMAVGVPVVAMPDAAHGMDLEPGQGLLLGETDEELAALCLRLVHSAEYAAEQSALARRSVEQTYSFDATYGCMTQALLSYARTQRH